MNLLSLAQVWGLWALGRQMGISRAETHGERNGHLRLPPHQGLRARWSLLKELQIWKPQGWMWLVKYRRLWTVSLLHFITNSLQSKKSYSITRGRRVFLLVNIWKTNWFSQVPAENRWQRQAGYVERVQWRNYLQSSEWAGYREANKRWWCFGGPRASLGLKGWVGSSYWSPETAVPSLCLKEMATQQPHGFGERNTVFAHLWLRRKGARKLNTLLPPPPALIYCQGLAPAAPRWSQRAERPPWRFCSLPGHTQHVKKVEGVQEGQEKTLSTVISLS